MKDIPVFTTENGAASLFLREIPYRKRAHIRLRATQEPEALLRECVDFCRACGAEWIDAAGLPYLETYPLIASILAMSRSLEGLPETDAALFPVLPETVMVLLVVNNAADCPEAWRNANWKLLELLRQGHAGTQIFWLDCSTPGRDLTRGVGEARKIGMDAVLPLIADAAGADDAVIYSLDADSPVAPEYFSRIAGAFAASQAGAVTLGVHHRGGETPEQEAAIRAYEEYLFHYRDGLRSAGSPYGFLTIGSAFAVRAATYIRAGGMRVREAGEDFYFLQAAAKCAPVASIDEALVFPSPRLSGRVPFGTGTAVRDLVAGEGVRIFPASAFAALGAFLAAATAENLAEPEKFIAMQPPEIAAFLRESRFAAAWRAVLANSRTPERLATEFHRWFDGLKTLQLLRRLGR